MKRSDPPFSMSIEDAKGDFTEVRGSKISGGVTKSGTGYTLTFSGGKGRSSVSVWLPLAHAATLGRALVEATATNPDAASAAGNEGDPDV